ncbi:glycosyltransferase [Mesorhizobium sp. M0684]|uniref:glycosyltransferase n=1 Tax=Mesorhizobium sp. M0684 TaxID=2956986 RepID=UPI00333CCF9A
MRIVHAITSIEELASGPSYSVPSLASASAALGNEVEVFSVGMAGRGPRIGFVHQRFRADKQWMPLSERLSFSASMEKALSASHATIIHNHGLWRMPNIYAARAARRSGAKLVISPRGMLSKPALRFSSTSKKLFNLLFQQRALQAADLFHATSHQEYLEIRDFGLMQPVAIIPNGIDLPDRQGVKAPGGRPYAISLGRLHPKKALDVLVRAWATLEDDYPDWQLKIVGPDERNYAAELQSLVDGLGVRSVQVSGPVYGSEKTALLEGAQLFALSSLNENFGIAVAESLASGTPVIASKGAPWQGLEEYHCGWWVDQSVQAFAKALSHGMSLSSEERRAMGERGLAWVQRDFAWSSVAEKMGEVYIWLAQGGEPPRSVQLT